jgi:ribosomal protein L14E/L6E/L27E
MALGAGMSGHRIGSVRSCAGPFAVNGVPIRRVNQAYVIATKTTVDVSAVNAAKFDDAYF